MPFIGKVAAIGAGRVDIEACGGVLRIGGIGGGGEILCDLRKSGRLLRAGAE
jgi:hypothetical protein